MSTAIVREALAAIEAGRSVVVVAFSLDDARSLSGEIQREARALGLPFRTNAQQPWKPLISARGYFDTVRPFRRSEFASVSIFVDSSCWFGRQHCPPPRLRTVFA